MKIIKDKLVALVCWWYGRRYAAAMLMGDEHTAEKWMDKLERAAGWYDLPSNK